jgi:hypothetical protein
MPNTIKYSTTGDTLSLEKGNFYIGVGDVPKGPTSTTGHWQGITPPLSGYTIYVNKASDGPTMMVPENDDKLIEYTKGFSGQPFTGVNESLNWYTTQSDYLCVNKDYEPIITDGLVLNVDASFTPSYPKNGNTWFDTSYSGVNSTLVNGITYGSSNGGSIVFDGTNDYAVTQTNINPPNITLEFFYKSLINDSYQYLISNARDCCGTYNGYELRVVTGLPRFTIWNSTASSVIGSSILLNQINHLAATYDGSQSKIYQNGALISTTNSTLGIGNPPSYNLAIGGMGLNPAAYNLNGEIYLGRIYNRSLTSSEILQNYQSTFTRFLGENIVTNGLVSYLDAGYGTSYPTTGTTWYDVSGYGRNGTLTNGPTYSNVSGGTIVFDGTDDYVTLGTQSFITNDFTVNLWYNLNTNTTKEHFLFSIGYSSGNSFLIAANSNLGSSQTLSSYYVNPGGNATGRTINSITVGNTVLVNLTYTRNNGLNVIYINGVEQTSRTFTESLSLGSSLQYILGYAIPRNKTTAYLQGNIYISQVYNRSLTQSEILQNFNAQKSRFGL